VPLLPLLLVRSLPLVVMMMPLLLLLLVPPLLLVVLLLLLLVPLLEHPGAQSWSKTVPTAHHSSAPAGSEQLQRHGVYQVLVGDEAIPYAVTPVAGCSGRMYPTGQGCGSAHYDRAGTWAAF
jgi:hypothetical protein